MRRLIISMTQEKLGKKLGVTFQQIQKYETGRNRIGSSRLHQAASVLGVPISYFFEGAAGAVSATLPDEGYVRDFIATEDGLSLVRAFSKISRRSVRRRIVLLVQSLTSDQV